MNVLETRDLTKKFGDFTAIDCVNLEIKENEIHAICGENGAGKSTLMNMIFGLLSPTSGEIIYKGAPITFTNPKEAIEQGIGMVHQHFKLVPSLSVYENIVLGQETTSLLGKVNSSKERKDVQATIDKFGFELDVDAKVANLSIGEQQRVEILKMLHRDVNILILDEPTAVLTPQETGELLDKLLHLKENGTTILIITHKLDEVKKVSDRITVIRKGSYIGTMNTTDVSEQQISRLMVGRDVITVKNDSTEDNLKTGEVLLEIKNLTYKPGSTEVLKNISLDIKAGEIIGIAGVEGNGQSELISILTGMSKKSSGVINYMGKELSKLTPTSLRQIGFSMIPEDRYKHGLNRDMSIWANMIAGRFDQGNVLKYGFMQMKNINSKTEQMVEKYDIRGCGNINNPVSSLSGGNAQKIIMAREIECNPNLVIMAQPTRGVDIGSIEFIHSEILKLKKQGKGILLVSSELSEIMNLSDRVYAIYKGELVGQRETRNTTKEELGMLMLGVKCEEGEQGYES